MKTLTFELTLEEANLIITALAKLPYEVSFTLIDKIKASGSSQLIEAKPVAETIEG